jgi:hypothetical protein
LVFVPHVKQAPLSTPARAKDVSVGPHGLKLERKALAADVIPLKHASSSFALDTLHTTERAP